MRQPLARRIPWRRVPGLLLGVATIATAGPPAGCALRLSTNTAEQGSGQPCQSAMECPQPTDPCLLAYCEQQQCIEVPSPEGPLPDSSQQPNDCAHAYCDGRGNATSYPAAYDVPADDANPCTEEVCQGSKPLHAALPAGTPCPTGFCNNAGSCAACRAGASECAEHAVRHCGPAGSWSAPEPCPASSPLCASARCVELRGVELGATHACARFDDGSVRCWGERGAGRLGTDPETLRPPAPGLSLRSISVGPAHSCGVDADGRAWCWGSNAYGQLGNGGYEFSSTPVAVALPADVEAWTAHVGRGHSCVLDRAGGIWCWGRNDRGQLGRGAAPKVPLGADDEPLPEAAGSGAPALATVADVSELRLTGSASCVRTATQATLRCWDMPDYAPPTTPPSRREQRAVEKASAAQPARIDGLDGVEALGLGGHFGCALTGATVSCWGANDHGQLGTAQKADRFTAAPVEGLSGVVVLAVAEQFACGATENGQLWCWGANDRGQLGHAGTDAPPTPVDGLAGVEDVRAGARFACATGSTFGVRCWGAGAAGQLGTGADADSAAPLPVAW